MAYGQYVVSPISSDKHRYGGPISDSLSAKCGEIVFRVVIYTCIVYTVSHVAARYSADNAHAKRNMHIQPEAVTNNN